MIFYVVNILEVLTLEIFLFANPSRQQTFGSVREFRISELLDQVFAPPRALLFLWCPLILLLQ